MSALKVDDALQAIAALQQEKAALLAALKAMVACCTDADGAVSPEPHDRGMWLDAMLNARATITDAERAK